MENKNLWIVAVIFFGIMDLVTTTIGLNICINEYQPIMRYLINNYTILSMYLLKFIVMGFFYEIHKYLPYNIGVPIGLSILGILITINNSLAIYLAI